MPIKEGIEYGVNEALNNLRSRPAPTPDLPLATRINLLQKQDPERYRKIMKGLIQDEKGGNEGARKLLGEIGEDAGRSRRGYEGLQKAVMSAAMVVPAAKLAKPIIKLATNPFVSAAVDVCNNYKNEQTFFTPNNLIAALNFVPINTKLGFKGIDASKFNDNKNRKKIHDLLNDVKESLFRQDGSVIKFDSRIDRASDYDDESLIFTQTRSKNNRDILTELGGRGYDLVTFKKINNAPTIVYSDKDYLDAIYRGDIKAAHRMRLQNFINKNSNQKYYRPDRPWFHMTNTDFVKFDGRRTGKNFGNLSKRFMRPTFYFGASPNYEHGNIMKKVLIKSNPEIDVSIRSSLHPYRPNSNSVLNTNSGQDLMELAVFDPKLIKSYDAITYDDYGNIIPLSMRDDFTKNDIRY